MIRAIPSDDKERVSKVFGRAAFFAIFDGTGAEPRFIEGAAAAEHGAGTGAVAALADAGVEEVIAAEFGPKARDALVAAGIAMTIAKAGAAFREALGQRV